MKRLIQIRGCNGSGKTTVVWSFIEKHRLKLTYVHTPFRKLPYPITHSEDGKICVLGKYEQGKCGGCDGLIKNKEELIKVLTYLFERIKPETLVFEGVIFGKTFELAKRIEKLSEAYGYKYLPIYLNLDFSECYERILKRNGGKEIDAENLYRTYVGAMRSAERLSESGTKVYCPDINEYDESEMFRIIEDVLE